MQSIELSISLGNVITLASFIFSVVVILMKNAKRDANVESEIRSIRSSLSEHKILADKERDELFKKTNAVTNRVSRIEGQLESHN